MKDGTYWVNLDEHESVGTHWLVLSVMGMKWHTFIHNLISLKLNTFQKEQKKIHRP